MADLGSNFGRLKTEFKNETGLDFNKENMAIYIQYYNAKMSDYAFQQTAQILQLLQRMELKKG